MKGKYAQGMGAGCQGGICRHENCGRPLTLFGALYVEPKPHHEGGVPDDVCVCEDVIPYHPECFSQCLVQGLDVTCHHCRQTIESARITFDCDPIGSLINASTLRGIDAEEVTEAFSLLKRRLQIAKEDEVYPNEDEFPADKLFKICGNLMLE